MVCRITDDAILGMHFLREYDCSLSCDKGILVVGTETVPCVDSFGRLLCNKVQVLRSTTVSPNSEIQVCCRLNSDPSGPLGLIENHMSADCGVVVAATLGRPGPQRRVIVRCLNVTQQPQELRAGTVIGLYQPIGPDQVVESNTEVQCRVMAPPTAETSCPEHVRALYEQGKEICANESEISRLQALLSAYANVFSTGEDDVGQTNLVEHSIPLHPGTQPIRQPPRRLGPEKDREVDEQVGKLVERRSKVVG